MKKVLRPLVAKARNVRNTELYGSCAVLLYHRVIDLDTDPQQLAVSPQNFDRHLSLLKKHHHVLSIEEFDHHLLHRIKFPKHSVLLTFDDGYADNHHQARPILEDHGSQALFYIASGYMGAQQEYWWDELERLLLLNDAIPKEFQFVHDRFELNWWMSDGNIKPMLEECYESSLVRLRALPSAERDAILGELGIMLKSGTPRASHLPMTVEELRAFAASPAVVIGAHTVGHPSLASLNESEQNDEIVGSKRALEEMLGKPVPYFSFPFGTGADFNDTTVELARAAGFDHVAANYPGIVHARSPQFKFPRFLVRNWNNEEFAGTLRTFFKT